MLQNKTHPDLCGRTPACNPNCPKIALTIKTQLEGRVGGGGGELRWCDTLYHKMLMLANIICESRTMKSRAYFAKKSNGPQNDALRPVLMQF